MEEDQGFGVALGRKVSLAALAEGLCISRGVVLMRRCTLSYLFVPEITVWHSKCFVRFPFLDVSVGLCPAKNHRYQNPGNNQVLQILEVAGKLS